MVQLLLVHNRRASGSFFELTSALQPSLSSLSASGRTEETQNGPGLQNNGRQVDRRKDRAHLLPLCFTDEQMYQYWTRFRPDSWFNKTCVSIALCADIGGMVATTSMCYLYTVTHFGEFGSSSFVELSLPSIQPDESRSVADQPRLSSFFSRRRSLRSFSTVSILLCARLSSRQPVNLTRIFSLPLSSSIAPSFNLLARRPPPLLRFPRHQLVLHPVWSE